MCVYIYIYIQWRKGTAEDEDACEKKTNDIIPFFFFLSFSTHTPVHRHTDTNTKRDSSSLRPHILVA